MNKLSASDRQALLKLASSLPKGDATRRAVLAGLKKFRKGAEKTKWKPGTEKALEELLDDKGPGLVTDLADSNDEEEADLAEKMWDHLDAIKDAEDEAKQEKAVKALWDVLEKASDTHNKKVRTFADKIQKILEKIRG